MPVRFQVDPDFYDHPKVTGMSDAAFSLWVRAGSYSAAKLTDGLVSEDVLVHTLRSSEQVANELVQRGLWRRTRGGFRFHQWANRNLTKERIEADRKVDRDRKRSTRNGSEEAVSTDLPNGTTGSKEVVPPQANTGFVRPDSARTPPGVQPDSTGIPAVSVSVSSSVSPHGSPRGERPVGGRASEQRPPERCPRHVNEPDAPPCGACGDHRRAADAWDVGHQQAAKSAIRACHLCDGDGWRYQAGRRIPLTPYGRCDHTRTPPEST